jgi:hypothetical protein
MGGTVGSVAERPSGGRHRADNARSRCDKLSDQYGQAIEDFVAIYGGMITTG